MIVYLLTRDFSQIPQGTKLFFNKTNQRFETFNRKYWISNEQSAKTPGMIVVHKVFEKKAKKKRVIIIPF